MRAPGRAARSSATVGSVPDSTWVPSALATLAASVRVPGSGENGPGVHADGWGGP